MIIRGDCYCLSNYKRVVGCFLGGLTVKKSQVASAIPMWHKKKNEHEQIVQLFECDFAFGHLTCASINSLHGLQCVCLT